MRSNIHWCSGGFQFTCWNGEVIRSAFFINAQDWEIVCWRAFVNAGASGLNIRDMIMETVERRFGFYKTLHPVKMPGSSGSCYIA